MLNDTLTMERNTIEDAVGGLTLVDVLARNARGYPDRPAIAWREDGRLQHLTWHEYRAKVLEVAVALIELGIEPGDAVAIMAANRPEHVIADLAAVHARATPVTLYSTFAPAQVAYVADDCRAKVAIVEDAETASLWMSIKDDLPHLEHIVVLRGPAPEGTTTWSDLCERGRERALGDSVPIETVAAGVQPHHLATLIYTSGTTGEPKGVELTQSNVLWTLEAMGMAVDLPDHPRLVSYLPLAHIAERAAAHYLGMWLVGEVTYCANVASIMSVLKLVRPHLVRRSAPHLGETLSTGLGQVGRGGRRKTPTAHGTGARDGTPGHSMSSSSGRSRPRSPRPSWLGWTGWSSPGFGLSWVSTSSPWPSRRRAPSTDTSWPSSVPWAFRFMSCME